MDGLIVDTENMIHKKLKEILEKTDGTLKLETKPAVILGVGVNGVGKTTSIGKIAARIQKDGKKSKQQYRKYL